MIIFYIGVVTLYYKPVDCGVLRALTDHGHHVTAFTTIPIDDRENYTEVDISKDIKSLIGLGHK